MVAFDVVIIGAGPGGYVAAIRAAQLGLKAALVEQEAALGGTCLRIGCIPSKALLESSEHYAAIRHQAEEHGIRVGSVELDLARLLGRKQRIVDELTSGVGLLMKKNKVSVFHGRGRLGGAGTVVVQGPAEEVRLQARAIVLATGSAPVALPGVPFDGRQVVTSTEALAFEEVPNHLVVVGAGAVGLELGSVWRRLGARVTVVEVLSQIVPFADHQVSQALKRALGEQGMDFRLQSRVSQVQSEGPELRVTVEGPKGEPETLTCDRLLVAIGRKPVTEGLGLTEAGVALDERGRVVVQPHFETGAAGIYAIGDLIHGPMLAHKASEEGVAVAEILAGRAGHVNYGALPSVVYTSPELAQVGLTEKEAQEKGIPFRTGKFFFKANGRAKCLGQVEGFVKMVAHAETDRLLGVHIVGPRASDLIAEVVTAFEFQATAEDLARTVHAHPTLAEVLKEAALAVDKRALHG